MPDKMFDNGIKIFFPLVFVVFFLFSCRPSTPNQLPDGKLAPTQTEKKPTIQLEDVLTTAPEKEVTPETEIPPQPPIKESFVSFESEGKVIERLLANLEEVDEIFKNKLLSTIERAELPDDQMAVQIIEREDEAGKVWHNALVGVMTNEGSLYLERIWLYAEANEAGSRYVLPGKGVEGRLIPIGVSYVVGGKSVGVSLPEGQRPEGILYSLGYVEESDFQGVREFIYFDLENNEVWYTDPWTGERYQLEDNANRGLLAKMVPVEAEVFPGLPVEKSREIFNQGLLPDKTSKGEWIAVNDKGEIVRLWNAENGSWVEPEVIVTKETYENINRWLEGDEFDYTEEDLFRNPENMDEKYPIGYYEMISIDNVAGYKSVDIVEVQGVLLGFGSQESEWNYKGEYFTVMEEVVYVGFQNPDSGERIVIPFGYGISFTSMFDSYLDVMKESGLYWHSENAPIFGGKSMSSESYKVDVMPEELKHVVGKPISIDYQVDHVFGKPDYESIFGAGEQAEKAQFGGYIWENVIDNDSRLLIWLGSGDGELENLKFIGVMKTSDPIFVNHIYAPYDGDK